MSYDFSLDRKRIVLALLASTTLIILIFFSGFLSGFMMGPAQRIRKEDITAGRRTGVAKTQLNRSGMTRIKQAPARPRTMLDQTVQEPRRSISRLESKKASKGHALRTMVRKPIAREAPLQKPVVAKPPEPTGSTPPQKMPFTVQAGAFLQKQNAEEFMAELRGKGYNPYIFETSDSKKREWYSVRIADCADLEEASLIASEFRKKEKMPAVITHIESLAVVRPKVAKPVGGTAPKEDKSDVTNKKDDESTDSGPAKKIAYLVQVGSYVVQMNAIKLVDDLKGKGYKPYIQKLWDSRDKPWYVVIIGDYKGPKKASMVASEFTMREKIVAIVVPVAAHVLEQRKEKALSASKLKAAEPTGAPEEARSSETPKEVQPDNNTK